MIPRLSNSWASAEKAQDEAFKDTKVRLSKRIGIKGKQFDKIKFAIIQRSIYSKPAFLNDGKSLLLLHFTRQDRVC